MEHRYLGASGLKVPALSFGAGTFGGQGPLFSAWGNSGPEEARRLVDICLDAGINMFDTADVYSSGASEEILGQALKGRRAQVLISTKTSLPMGDGPYDAGSSRERLIRACEASLRRLQTEYIDVYYMHAFDAHTPIEEVLYTLDLLIRQGKIRYIGVSNFSGWQIMKSLAISEKYGYARYIANQSYYSLIGRDYEWELMPLGKDQGLGAAIWSPLGWGRLTGKIRRNQPWPSGSRLHESAGFGPPVDEQRLYQVIDVMDEIVGETDRSVPEIALNWLLQRPTVSTVVIGARNEIQLRQNLGAVGWTLSPDQVARLDKASEVMPAYPYYPYRIQEAFARLNPSLV